MNDLKALIKQQAQELYGKEKNFCIKYGYVSTDFNSKKQTMQNKFDDLNEFLAPLDLKVTINKIQLIATDTTDVNEKPLSTHEIKEVRKLIIKNARY